MDTTQARLATLAGLALLASCQIAKLFDTPPTEALAVTPARFFDSSAAGAAPHVARLVIAAPGRPGPEPWNAYHAIDVTWLQFGDSRGAAPDTLFFTLDPIGLDPGTYDDQIAIVPVDTELAWVRVPVKFTILPAPPPPPPPPPTPWVGRRLSRTSDIPSAAARRSAGGRARGARPAVADCPASLPCAHAATADHRLRFLRGLLRVEKAQSRISSVVEVRGVRIPLIGLDDLIETKRTGRLQDAADIEALEEIRRLR